MEKLPPELLAMVFARLHPIDRLNCAQVCRRWERVVTAPQLLEDVQFVIRGSNMRMAEPILMRTTRSLHNFDRKLWTKIGRSLRELELIKCTSTPRVLFAILCACRSLESLVVCATNLYPTSKLGLPRGMKVEDVRRSLRCMRHLSLRDFTEHHITGVILGSLLDLMPSLTSISLAFFFPDENSLQDVLSALLKSHSMFTKIDISFGQINDESVIKIVERYSSSLEHIVLSDCYDLTREAFAAIGSCSKLRHVDLQGAHLGDENVAQLLRGTPDVECLELWGGDWITDQCLTHVYELKKLRSLSMVYCAGICGELLRNSSRLSSLQHLDLTYEKCDISVFQNIRYLEDIRSLRVECRKFKPDCFAVIVENLKKLEQLHLQACQALTDSDGVKLRNLKRLKVLRLWDAFRLTDLTFEHGVGSSDMEELSLLDCSLSDVGLASIAAHHGRLKKLSFKYCARITDAGMTSLLRREPFLRTLMVMFCSSITEVTLSALEGLCPHLDFVDFSDCQIGFLALHQFAQRRPTVGSFACIDCRER
ncbi:F-box/LRR-repeat protein 20-like [Galendromus occidentalis]|uniref:F-box/LRR-repeat protein 20-like n=1 Tax=Galendromus occidentalis TaxID=34638 RepID=A0AAJ6QRV6_9ACAR|nr:F-box/LRR-repeat protein 20-like [Galendromus occidentalis]